MRPSGLNRGRHASPAPGPLAPALGTYDPLIKIANRSAGRGNDETSAEETSRLPPLAAQSAYRRPPERSHGMSRSGSKKATNATPRYIACGSRL